MSIRRTTLREAPKVSVRERFVPAPDASDEDKVRCARECGRWLRPTNPWVKWINAVRDLELRAQCVDAYLEGQKVRHERAATEGM